MILHRRVMNEPVSFGPIIEEGLIIGFSILALLIIVSIIISVLDWSQSLVNDFIQDIGG